MKPTPPTPKNEYCIKNSQLENAFIDKNAEILMYISE